MDYPLSPDGRESADLAFVLTSDRNLSIFQLADSLTEVYRVSLGGAYGEDVRVDPQRQLAYVAAGAEVLLFDISKLVGDLDLIDGNEDGIDDRFLGSIPFSGARSLLLDGCTGYVGDMTDGQIITVSLCPAEAPAAPDCSLTGIGLENDAFPVTEPVRALAYPLDAEVTWEMLDQSPTNNDITIDPTTGLITLGEDFTEGWVSLRATQAGATLNIPPCTQTAWIPVGCCGCGFPEGTCGHLVCANP